MNNDQEKQVLKVVVSMSRYLILMTIIAFFCIFLLVVYTFNLEAVQVRVNDNQAKTVQSIPAKEVSAGSSPRSIPSNTWKAPDESTLPDGERGEMIRYGRDLIVSTAKYLGPKGTVAHLTNGMNCQNCHLSAGTKLFSNNFSGFIASYPKFSGRSGKTEPASERIAECFERSLNGRVPDTSKKEIQAILAYMKWIGKDVKKGQKGFGAATEKLAFLNQPTDPVKGKTVFVMKCQSCHGQHGEGVLAADKKSFTNPPLWGSDSYNDGAGMYRLINFAGFVKNNMPFGATYQSPQLTDEEAWNVAAFVNSQPRPHLNQGKDYPDPSKKPIDLPFGPFADKFGAKQHKLGPFGPIQQLQKTNTSKNS